MSSYTKQIDGIRLEPYFHRYTDTRPLASTRGELFIRPDTTKSAEEIMADIPADEHAELLDWLLDVASHIHAVSGMESAIALPAAVFSTERGLHDFLYLAASSHTRVSFELRELPEHLDSAQLDHVLSHIREHGHHSSFCVDSFDALNADRLAQLRVDAIKFASAFTADDPDAEARAELERRFQMLADAGKEHVVCGVEAQRDFEWLKGVGYTTFQGLWFGMPTPAQQLTQRQ